MRDHRTNPRKRDTDGDGASDGAEVRAGSDPLDPGSLPGDAEEPAPDPEPEPEPPTVPPEPPTLPPEPPGPGATPPPTAAFTVSAAPRAGQTVTFDASASTCAATPCAFTWSDDGPDGSGGASWPLGSGARLAFRFSDPARSTSASR